MEQTPKEFAEELFDKAKEFANNTHFGIFECEESFKENCIGIANMCVDEKINTLKKILDESTNIYQSLNTPKKLCIDIINPILKELEEVKQELLKM